MHTTACNCKVQMSISWSSKIHVSLLFLHNMAAVVFSSDYFVLDTDEILSSAPFYQHDIVFLQVVSLSRYESNDFFAIAEPHFGTFTVGRVWLLWLPYQRSDNDLVDNRKKKLKCSVLISPSALTGRGQTGGTVI